MRKNKDKAKFRPRSYRFSRTTHALLSKISKRTGKEQNIVVQKALKMYEEQLNKAVSNTSMLDKALAGDTEYDKKIVSAIENA